MTQTPPSSDPRLYLIDGSGFIFRAYHALPPMNRPDGTPVNAVYGFCTMLQKLMNDMGATRIAVIFDAARKTFRQDIYPAYKANRPPPPEDLIPQFPLIREATRAYGLPSIELENFEADDLIASYARAALAEGQKVRIVSADKDLMQLVRPGVELFDPMKATPIGAAEVEAKFGVSPEKVTDVQALAGDSTDNVPGVPGIGVKTAAQLIGDFGDLETLLAKAHTIKQPKRREALLQNADLARISKRLVTLDEAAPLPLPLDALRLEPDGMEARVAFLRQQGFASLIARLKNKTETSLPSAALSDQSVSPSSDKTESPEKDAEKTALLAALTAAESTYQCLQTPEDLQRVVDEARASGRVAIDTETDSLVPSTAKLVGISLAIAPGKAFYIPVAHTDPAAGPEGGFAFHDQTGPQQIPLDSIRAILRPLLQDDATLKIGHNIKYDMEVLTAHGFGPIAPYDDTMLLSYVLEAGLHGHGLDELALRHFQHKMISFDDVTGTGRARITFDRVPLDLATDYAAEDADFTFRLWLYLRPLVAQSHVMRVYERIERPLVPIVAAMEEAGICIDADLLRVQSARLAERMQKLETEIHALAGHPFNLASPKQLGEVLFAEQGLPGAVKSKTGAFSTSADVLEPLAETYPLVAKLLDHRGLAKLRSTYTDALPGQIQAKTGRVHTSFSLVGAATGRLSSTDPNLQNIPIRTEEGRAIRQAFIAAPGHVLLSVDYSQIELRLAAEAAEIKTLIQAFADGVDIHALTAAQVFGLPLEEVSAERRRAAKAINFGIVYGISGFGLAKQIGCSPGEAAAFIRDYLDRFHELRDWIETTKAFAHAHGYVETLFGRRVHVPGIREKLAVRRAGAERQAINAPLQGTAADIIKRAMIRLPSALTEAGLQAKLLLQVHDELILEVPEAEITQTAPLVQRVMVEAPLPVLQMKVPLVAEAGFAANWAAAH